MRGVIYARYSSDNQREESIEGQIRENMAFAKKNGIDIVGTYIDRALSAKTDNRPEFQRMIKDSAKKNFDVVIVWKLDRFSRNRYDSAKYKAMLKKNDVKVVSATEAISEGAEGIILESVLEGMAEYYSADLAEKVTRGMTENALKCKYNGSAVPYGYRIDEDKHYQIDPATAPVALEIFTRYAGGETAASIINDLNSRGLKNNKGKEFNKNSFHNMVKNRTYIGEYHYSDVIIPGGVPAIIPDDIFERAVARMESNKRTAAKNKAKERYILTTKLFCGNCKTMMVGDSGQKKNGNIYRYYKCAAAKRHECNKKTIRKDLIEDFVIAHTMYSITDEDSMQKIIKQILALQDEENTVIPALEAQLKDVKNGIDNLVKAIEAGVFTRSTKARLEELEAEEERLQASIRDEQVSHPKITENHIRCMFDKYRDMDMSIPANRERLIDRLVGSILLYDDGKIVITFYYKDEPFVGMLEEIASASDKVGSDTNALGSPVKTNPNYFAGRNRFGFVFFCEYSFFINCRILLFSLRDFQRCRKSSESRSFL